LAQNHQNQQYSESLKICTILVDNPQPNYIASENPEDSEQN